MIKLSIVIPVYNEVKNFKRGVLDMLYGYLSKQKYSWEVLIMDDESTDESAEVVSKFIKTHKGFTLFREPHRGKGGNVIAGMLRAKGEILLFEDMDQSTPINQIEKFWPKFEKGYDIVIGSRRGRHGTNGIRKLMSVGWMAVRSILLSLPYKDTQCGFKAFRRDAANEIFKRMQVFRKENKTVGKAVNAGFDLEILYIARKLKLKVAEVPVEWYDYGHRQGAHFLKDSWDGMKEILKIRLNAIQGKYNV